MPALVFWIRLLVTGEFLQISSLDIFAFDVIGWDLEQDATAVPESSGLVLLGSALLALGFVRRRKLLLNR